MAIIKNVAMVITEGYSRKFILPPQNCGIVYTDARINSNNIGLGIYYQNDVISKRLMAKVINNNINININNGELMAMLYGLKSCPKNIPIIVYTNSISTPNLLSNSIKNNSILNTIKEEINNRTELTWMVNTKNTIGIWGTTQANILANNALELTSVTNASKTDVKLNDKTIVKIMFSRVHKKL